MRLRTRRLATAAACLVGLVATGAASPSGAAPPTADLHELTWNVHVDLIDAGAGRDLAFWQGVLETAMAEANLLLEGNQGTLDQACCTRIEPVTVVTFGTPGDGLDVIDSAADSAWLQTVGTGSQAFLVDSLSWCGGPALGAIGCANLPSCTGNPNDDPDLVMTVTVDALDSEVLGATVAHERGHNACLPHVDTATCQLMRPSAGGGCLSVSECTNLMAGRTGTGGSCGCHDGAGGLLADGSFCAEVADGQCSGGVCGGASSDAAVTLIASAAPESADGGATDDALRISALPGGWVTLGAFTPTGEEITGLAYATDSDTLFGVIPTLADDLVVSVDRDTGAVIATLGTIANGSDRLEALAYDPGGTGLESDDRLLALESDGTFEDLVEIDPANPNSRVILGPLANGGMNGYRGLAYDSLQDRLFVASPFPGGISEIATSCSINCAVTPLYATGGIPRFDASLAYSATTGKLYVSGTQVGTQTLGRRNLYDVVDPVTWERRDSRTVQAFTPAGLAALPPPPECGDGVDNDGDGFVDFPADPGCASGSAVTESPECQDGIDNDGQLGTDFDGGESVLGVGNGDPNGADPQCASATGTAEAGGGGVGCGLGPELALLLPLLGLGRLAARRRG